MLSHRFETQPPGGAAPLAEAGVVERLDAARRRTLELVADVDDADLERVFSRLMSPLAWDLGHIAAFEDLWLCRVAGLEPLRPGLAEVYDATETPRAQRGNLEFLRADEVRDYLAAVRERTLDHAERLAAAGGEPNPGGFLWDLIVQHEQQHNETMLQTLQLAPPGLTAPPRAEPPPAPEWAGVEPDPVEIPAGRFHMGAGSGGFAYDNERPRHAVDLAGFRIDRAPVTNARYAEWVYAGGYRRREWWSDAGWRWKTENGIEQPLFWTADGWIRSFERFLPRGPDRPVMNVSWYEADAYARAHGKRLPTEAEWERAALGDAEPGHGRRYPWGDDPPEPEHANLDAGQAGPAPVGAYPSGAAPSGALGMIGDVWEWTATEFAGYPGFRAWPYREYSEIFFATGHRVLRGGSWATRPGAIRGTFRNWDLPQRRQIFAGFRCAEDL